MTTMNKSFERIQKRAQEAKAKAAKAESATEENTPPALPTQMNLPLELLGHGARGAPDAVLRSALFAATRPGKRRMLDNEKIASVSNVDIRQTGPQLQQIDLDVWIELVRLAAEAQSSVITVPVKGLLRRMKRDSGSKSRESLLSTLRRLNSTLVGISDGKRDYDGTLVFDHSRDERQQLVIQLNPRIAALFDKTSWSTVQLEQRRQLKRQPLGQWLHGYLSSHARPFPIKVATIRTLSGSTTKTLFHFRDDLKAAMRKVEEATGWKWQIDATDKLIVDRSTEVEINPQAVD